MPGLTDEESSVSDMPQSVLQGAQTDQGVVSTCEGKHAQRDLQRLVRLLSTHPVTRLHYDRFLIVGSTLKSQAGYLGKQQVNRNPSRRKGAYLERSHF